MRTSPEIDYDADKIGSEETLIRLLCSPLYYNEQTKQVNIDAFDLRMIGKRPESYVSLGRKSKFIDEDKKKNFLKRGSVFGTPRRQTNITGTANFNVLRYCQ